MGDRFFLLLVINSVFFSFIFWALTLLSRFFYYDKYSNFKLDFYECGFRSVTAIRINIPVQFILVSIFLIVYDSEFLVLYPVVFNLAGAFGIHIFLLFYFLFFLLAALVIDYVYSALDWHL